MSPAVAQLLTLMIPIIVGVATVPLFNLIKKFSAYVDNLPPAIKQLVVLVIAWAMNQIAHLTGLTLPTSLGGFDSATTGTMVSTVLAYLLHLATQVSTVKAAQPTPPPVAKP